MDFKLQDLRVSAVGGLQLQLMTTLSVEKRAHSSKTAAYQRLMGQPPYTNLAGSNIEMKR